MEGEVPDSSTADEFVVRLSSGQRAFTPAPSDGISIVPMGKRLADSAKVDLHGARVLGKPSRIGMGDHATNIMSNDVHGLSDLEVVNNKRVQVSSHD